MSEFHEPPRETALARPDCARWLLLTLRRAAWMPVALIVFHIFILLVLDAYTRFPPIDIPMHFLGGVSAAYFLRWAALTAAECKIRAPLSPAALTRFVLIATFAVTVLWEIAEFFLDRRFGSHLQLGPLDTLGDMFTGVCGAAALLARYGFALPARTRSDNHRPSSISKS